MSPELAIGAIAEGIDVEPVIDEEIVAGLDIDKTYIEAEIARQKREIIRREQLYAAARPAFDIREMTAIVVDDGIATGATMKAAVRASRRRQPRKLVLAVPVAPREAIERLRHEVDEVVCLSMPDDFDAVASFYRDFSPVEDEVVILLLKRAGLPRAAKQAPQNTAAKRQSRNPKDAS
jgi:putative phosphoribosyl transferase